MIKYVVNVFLLLAVSQQLSAQNLVHIPPMSGKGHAADSTTSFLFTTLDEAMFEPNIAERPYTQSVQIADADAPWPPRWYTNTPYHTYSENKQDSIHGVKAYDLVLDAKVEPGNLAFSETCVKVKGESLVSKSVWGYLLLNKQYEVVDTVISVRPSKIYGFHLNINKAGERLVSIVTKNVLDLRHLTGNPADTGVHSAVDVIEILRKDNSVKFSWNPLEKLDTAVFHFHEKLHCQGCVIDTNDDIDWTQLTSVLWDYDGNILYSFKGIGIGKISARDGKLLWHIDAKDLPLFAGKDTIQWFSPQDFNLIAENDSFATYTIYSLGSQGPPVIRPAGIIFKINKKTNELKLVKNINPEIRFSGEGQGNFDYYGKGDYVFYFKENRGGEVASSNLKNELQYTKNDSITSVYKLPAAIDAYKVHRLDEWPRPPRPVVVQQNGMLQVQGNWNNVVWYTLSGPGLQKTEVAGTGTAIKPLAGATYCAEAPYGIGYAVSKPFKVNK